MATYDRPVSIIFGAEDPTLNIATANAFHEIFPNSTLELIDGDNHYVQYDAHERVAELIQAAATP